MLQLACSLQRQYGQCQRTQQMVHRSSSLSKRNFPKRCKIRWTN
ncbi:hypothetical protein EDM57_02640 [Brevibacillus gelatini]|uniref:CPW-WPC domain-containing protein n=1 Tax=Brevibacillus gelatini TaxID=1655277 RepID=A0A3M8BBE9_9BACL|nr:hypothetical protein EDM57_02640 [Brevibacillus gelatini]